MGRITLFGTNDCPHCMRAKGALIRRGLPFSEIDLSIFPHRRNDMLSLYDQFSVPQVFFNEKYVGGADDLLEILERWDSEESMSPLETFRQSVAPRPDPTDPRLALPSPFEESKMSPAFESSGALNQLGKETAIQLPNGDYATVLDVMLTLDKIFDTQDRPYKAHRYKNCFINSDGVTDIMNHFGCQTRKEAVDFGRELQRKKILDHVCGEHPFRDDGYYFFRLQRYHHPYVLNSFRVWTEPVDIENASTIIFNLKRWLYKVLSNCTDNDGMIDYIKACEDPNYPKFEEAACELQCEFVERSD
jgi:glutaredoxin